MPTKANKQYISVQRVREATETHGTKIRPVISRGMRYDNRTWSDYEVYHLRLLVDGKNVLGSKGSNMSLELLNQCLGTITSTLDQKKARKR